MNQGRSLQQSQDWNGLYDLVDVECEDEVKGNSPQSLQQTQDQCNQQDSYNPNLDGNCLDVEIFNPIPAPKGRYPYFVSLQQRLVEGNLDRYRHFCGGALITRDIILTAAHCIWSKGSTDFRDTGDGKGNGVLREGGIFIALGPYCRHQQGLQRIIAKDFFMNPKYNGYPYQSDDIILLKTETPFDYTGPFPDFESAQNFVYESNDYVVTAMGHGAQTLEEAKENKDNIDILGRQVVPLGLAFFQYLPEDQCDVEVKTVSQQLKIYPDKMVCFVSRAQDTCFGDSGSPVIVAGGDSSAAFGDPSQDVLIGLTSWGPDLDCNGAGLPGVYTRLGNYVDWMIAILQEQSAYFQKSQVLPTPSPAPEPTPSPAPEPTPSPAPEPTPTPTPSQGIPDECLLKMDVGPGEASFTRWYYDAVSKQCSEFTWGGFSGNKNNFKTQALCESACITFS